MHLVTPAAVQAMMSVQQFGDTQAQRNTWQLMAQGNNNSVHLATVARLRSKPGR
jgi:hypothetical protein